MQALGRTQANALLAETLRIEEQGGLAVLSGARRRSSGGIFFHLAYTTGITKAGEPLSRQVPQVRHKKAAIEKREPVQPPAPPFRWEDRKEVITAIGTTKGKVTTVKITLIGQLGSVADRRTAVPAGPTSLAAVLAAAAHNSQMNDPQRLQEYVAPPNKLARCLTRHGHTSGFPNAGCPYGTSGRVNPTPLHFGHATASCCD